MISVSVPGKIHLLGEHSVVYGKPALLSAINLKVTLSISYSSTDEIIFDHPQYIKDLINLKKIIQKSITKRFPNASFPPLKIALKSELPIGSGLGSSAAISTAFALGLLKFACFNTDNQAIFEIALDGEKYFHGNPSGGDVAACLYGGLIWFRKETDFIKTITPLTFKIHKNIKQFFLIDSGKPVESTSEMVKSVSDKRQVTRDKFEKIFDDQEELTKQLATALKAGDYTLIQRSIKEGERNLEKLGVVGKKAKEIIKQIEKLGGVGKILGGGGVRKGSGMILAYHNNPKKILEFAKKNSWEILDIKL